MRQIPFLSRLSKGLAVAGVALSPQAAGATWSVVAVDPATGQVGIAGASCIGGVERIAGIAPGIGALAAQAQLDFANGNRDYALELLKMGVAPEQVISMTNEEDANSWAGSAQSRQYGVVDLMGRTATFTGSSALPWAGDAEGTNVTVQGNILYAEEVVTDALAAFEAAAADCKTTLADRLMDALEAGALQGGDSRCSESQAALSAFMVVAEEDDTTGSYMLELVIPNQSGSGQNPVTLLRTQYDMWRDDHPSDGNCGGDGTTGDGATGDSGDTATESNGGTDSGSPSAGDGGATGCACVVPLHGSGGTWPLLTVAAVLSMRRRWSRRSNCRPRWTPAGTPRRIRRRKLAPPRCRTG